MSRLSFGGTPATMTMNDEETDIYHSGGEEWDDLRAELIERVRKAGVRGTMTLETADGVAWDVVIS